MPHKINTRDQCIDNMLPHCNAILPTVRLNTSICSGVHESRLTDFTLDICTPKFLWMPAQRIHMKTPRFQLAQRGPAQRERESDVIKQCKHSDIDKTLTALKVTLTSSNFLFLSLTINMHIDY